MLETFTIVNSEFPWFFAIAAAVFGALVGSFLNVCIYRIPAERSVVTPGSTCACGAPIRFFNNIPVLSWLLLRGRANCCGQRFSFRYPAIELLTAILFLAVWLLYSPIVALVGMLFISFILCAVFIDLDHMIIPDRFSAGGMILGVILSTCVPELHGIAGEPIIENVHSFIVSLVGAVVGAGVVYWFSALGYIVLQKDAMGEGDVKFVGFIGAFCGWQGAVFSMFGGALIGTVLILPFLLMQKLRSSSTDDAVDRKEDALAANRSKAESVSGNEDDDEEAIEGFALPFGPMLGLGGLIYFLGFRTHVDAYFDEIVSTFMLGIF